MPEDGDIVHWLLGGKVRRIIAMALVAASLGGGIGAARANLGSDARSVDGRLASGAPSYWASGELIRSGFAETASGSVAVYFEQGHYQGGRHDADPSGPSTRSFLNVRNASGYRTLPLSFLGVSYDPTTDHYRIVAAGPGCSVQLEVEEATDRYNGQFATSGVVGNYAGVESWGLEPPSVYTGSDGSWTGTSAFAASSETRRYVGTVCGQPVQMDGDVSYVFMGGAVVY